VRVDVVQVAADVAGLVSEVLVHDNEAVDAGKPPFALIDSDSFDVDGYFEETKLPRVKIGDPARVYLIGESAVIESHVESVPCLAIAQLMLFVGSSLLLAVTSMSSMRCSALVGANSHTIPHCPPNNLALAQSCPAALWKR
jgi:hypothetical protein